MCEKVHGLFTECAKCSKLKKRLTVVYIIKIIMFAL